MSEPDQELTEAEQQALVLAEQSKQFQIEARKWDLLAENVENEAAKQIAEAYRDTWESELSMAQAKLQDLNRQLGFMEEFGDE